MNSALVAEVVFVLVFFLKEYKDAALLSIGSILFHASIVERK